MNENKNQKLKLFQRYFVSFFFIFLFVFFPAQFINAQGAPQPCECFCATDKGAKPPGDTLEAMSVRECQTACKNNGDKVAACAFDLSEYPEQNPSCFNLDQCTKAIKAYCGDASSDTSSKEYSTISCESGSVADSFETKYQPPECPPNFHYCYAPKNSTSVRLNIQIGGTSQVNNLETYVQVAYQWMVTAGVIIAIVLVMIGGLQYVLGAASQSQISSAKKRIQNAVIGLILLLSCILIIETVNPKLSSIAVPRFPMIKTVNLAGSGKSCEILVDEDKFTVGYNPQGQGTKKVYTQYTGSKSPGCGTLGAVLKGPEDSAVTAGMTCNFQNCDSLAERLEPGFVDGSSRCIGSGNKAACFSCGELYDGNEELKKRGIAPSSSLCGQFTRGIESGTAEKPDTIHRCGWTKDGDYNEGTGAIKPASSGACVNIVFDCKAIRSAGCEGYADVPANNDIEGEEKLSDADVEPNASFPCLGPCADFSMKTICNENPCKVPTGCYFVEESTSNFFSKGDCMPSKIYKKE